jgi:hypothetical protein
MKRAIRLGVITGLVVCASASWGGARADEGPSPTAATSEGPVVVDAEGSAAKESRNGAGGMEPQEVVDEDPGTGEHRAWVESIWTAP